MTLLNALLRLYPRAWRDRYEEEFRALLEQNLLSPIDALDIARGALDAHLRPQVTAAQVKSEGRNLVGRTSFIKWSGMAGMVGSILVLLGLLSMSVAAREEYPYMDDVWDITTRAVFLAGVVLTLLFTSGFLLAYGRKLGGLGQIGLLVAFAGLLSMTGGISGAVADAVQGIVIAGWWDYFSWGLVGTLAGSGIFSIAGIANKALPSLGSKLTAIGALLCLVALLASMGFSVDASRMTPATGFLLAATWTSFTTFKVGLILLGYALWSGREPVARQVDPAVTG